MLTNPVLDPFGKIPEFKYCAVKVSKGGPEPKRMSFGGGVLIPEQKSGLVSVSDGTAPQVEQPEPAEVGV